jgi:hypothetical protein
MLNLPIGQDATAANLTAALSLLPAKRIFITVFGKTDE